MSIKQMIMDENGTLLKVNPDGTISILLADSDVMQQTDIQRRFQKTIQTHTSAVVANNGVSNSVYIDTNGFNEIMVTLSNDAAVNSQIHFHWSNDGVNMHSLEMMTASALQSYPVNTVTKARYVRVVLKNADPATGVSHTMNAWAYLKV